MAQKLSTRVREGEAWLSFKLAINEGICVLQTHLVKIILTKNI